MKFGWGGRREGAGRKPTPGKPASQVEHRSRPRHSSAEPVLVTWKAIAGVPSLRESPAPEAIAEAISLHNKRHHKRHSSFRVIHYGLQEDHLHVIVEAGSKRTLMRALAGLGIGVARRLNVVVGRRGQAFVERYVARALTTPQEVRDALLTVLQNHRRQGPTEERVDECSSAAWFAGWAEPVPVPELPSPVALPRTKLLTTAWQGLGPIRFDEDPAPYPPPPSEPAN